MFEVLASRQQTVSELFKLRSQLGSVELRNQGAQVIVHQSDMMTDQPRKGLARFGEQVAAWHKGKERLEVSS